jgi:hypothetical protein
MTTFRIVGGLGAEPALPFERCGEEAGARGEFLARPSVAPALSRPAGHPPRHFRERAARGVRRGGWEGKRRG